MHLLASSGMYSIQLSVATSTSDYVLNLASYPLPTALTVTVASGVTIYSVRNSAAFTITGTLPAGSSLRLINNGFIAGGGGRGGNGMNYSGGGSAGWNGVDALLMSSASTALQINNTNGYIFGGGGGGGGGGLAGFWIPPVYYVPGGGGGGGRSLGLNSTPGYAGSAYDPEMLDILAQDGAAGTSAQAGRGGGGARLRIYSVWAGAGGVGGDYGQAGGAGGSADSYWNRVAGFVGGAGGYAVRITGAGSSVIFLGGYNSAQVKGTVA